MATRGIVLGAQALLNSEGEIVWPLPHPEELRRYALYWDFIDFPHVNATSFTLEKFDDYQAFQKKGILLESQLYYLRSGEILINPEAHLDYRDLLGYGLKGDLLTLKKLELQGQIMLADRHNQHAPDQVWSIANSVLDQYIPRIHTQKTVEVELVNSILSPGRNVPMDEIFQFKETRSPELLKFRDAMDKLYLDISKSVDLDRAFIRAKEEVIKSILTINRLMQESRMQRVLSSVKVRLNETLLYESIGSAIASAGMADLLDHPLALGAAIGAVLPTIVFALVEAFKDVKIPASSRDFMYAYDVGRYLD